MFEKLYKLTKLNEEVNECPLVICGMFCNTDGENVIDFEFCGIGKPSGFMFDNADLEEALNGAGVNISDFRKTLEIIMKEFAYYDEDTNTYLSLAEFRTRAHDYIIENYIMKDATEERPTIEEVMLNMDNITKVEW